MKLTIISDIHGLLPEPADMPNADVLIIAGDSIPLWCDFNEVKQYQWLKSDFTDWLGSLEYPHIVGIAGNHDLAMQESDIGHRLPWTYLQDSEVSIMGLKFYGSPMSLPFGPFAFMAPEIELDMGYWSAIPTDVNVLIIHGPMYGRLDKTYRGPNAGSVTLRDRIDSGQYPDLKLFVNGHIHEARGILEENGVIYANAAHMDIIGDSHHGASVIDL